MSSILSAVFRWLAGKMAALVLILAVLVIANWLQGGLKKVDELKNDLATLDSRIDALSKRIGGLTDQQKKADAALRDILKEWKGKLAILDRARAERQTIWDKHPFGRKNPLSRVWRQLKLLDAQIYLHQEAVNFSTRRIDAAADAFRAMIDEFGRMKRDAQKLQSRKEDVEEKLTQNFAHRLIIIVRTELPTALGILLGIVLIPIGIKVLFYFIVAPWAAGRTPIRLLPSASGSILSHSPESTSGNASRKMSAVSQPIVLGATQELLIRPEFLQSTSLQARKETKWFLNNRFLFSSLLSGMFMLTRVIPAGSEPVVISATKDPLSEVGILYLAEGAAFVCQPHSLAGVIQDPSNPIRIEQLWRLSSLQSWLTLQLRFLVFHGPGQLVMKGCRGIRIESAGAGRLINQSATLGFSANLDYANTRCETFVSYWTGKEDLFNDLFTGQSGVYVYEEMPDLKRTTGITGRGLEGFTDSVLKVFGV